MNRTSPLRSEFTVTQAQMRLSAARPVRVQRAPTRRVAPHGHEYYEIGVVAEGTATHLTAAGSTRLRSGSILVVPPGPVHGYESGREFQIINVYYLAEWLLAELHPLQEPDGLAPLFLGASLFPDAPRPPILQVDLDGAQLAECLRELGGLETELQSATPSRVFLKATFLRFLVLLSRALVRQRGQPCAFQFRREVGLTLEEIENALENSRSLRMAAVARQLGRSPKHITRLFKQETGSTPRDHFQSRRIQRACTYLLNPVPTITEIAHQLGFSDAAHFCRVFTRWQKCSPRAYRRQYAVRRLDARGATGDRPW